MGEVHVHTSPPSRNARHGEAGSGSMNRAGGLLHFLFVCFDLLFAFLFLDVAFFDLALPQPLTASF